jgi:hypothetical protein
MMIGTREEDRIVRQTSRPSMSGSIRSSRTTSGSSRRTASSAAAPVAATSTPYPSRSSAERSGSEIDCSSSTTTTRVVCAGGGIHVWSAGIPGSVRARSAQLLCWAADAVDSYVRSPTTPI